MTSTPEKRLIQAGRKTRDALRTIRDLVRAERKQDIYNQTFAKLDEAVENATDGLIEISSVFEIILHSTGQDHTGHHIDVMNLHALQESLSDMKAEREELRESLQGAQEQLQKYADDLAKLFAQEKAKRAELAMAYERLQQADRLKSDFLNTVTHELTSPLVPLDLNLQIIGRGKLDPEQQHNLEESQQLLNQYKQQLDGLIKYAALVSQSHMVNPKPIEIPELIDEVIEPLKILARGRNIELQIYPIDSDINLVADKDLASSAIYQLVHNAIKFNQPGGHVGLRVQPEMQDYKAGVLFQIADDGVGIPDVIIERLGQDFNQIVDAVRRGVEGLGLGLALSSYVAEAHGGTLSAFHGEKGGTVIHFWLPENELA